MSGRFHTPPEHIEPIVRWYKKAQVDYVEQYVRMYIAYNAWYHEVTGAVNDRQALSSLKKRTVIWDDYTTGKTMKTLSIYMERLVDLTQHEPLAKTIHWSGSIAHKNDWRSLIEYWYQIRCLLVHGASVKPRFVWLAYETLDVFMSEIVDRMYTTLDEHNGNKLGTSQSEGVKVAKNLQHKLYEKYVTSADIWQVDMKRVQ